MPSARRETETERGMAEDYQDGQMFERTISIEGRLVEVHVLSMAKEQAM